MEIHFIEGQTCKPYEYLCMDCGNCVLSLVFTLNCSFCNSTNIKKGMIGELDLDKLRKEIKGNQ